MVIKSSPMLREKLHFGSSMHLMMILTRRLLTGCAFSVFQKPPAQNPNCFFFIFIFIKACFVDILSAQIQVDPFTVPNNVAYYSYLYEQK